MKRHRPSRVLLSAAVLALLPGAHGLRVATAQSAPTAPPFRHPLLALTSAPGPRPLFDARDDPQGRRYVVGDGGGALAAGLAVSTSSGLYLASRRPLRTDERGKIALPLSLRRLPVIHPDLDALRATSSPQTLVRVTIGLKDDAPGFQAALERSIVEGRVRSREELDQARDRLHRLRQQTLATRLRPVLSEVQALGGRVESVCRNMPCLRATIPAGRLTPLAARPDVIEIDLARPILPDALEPVLQAPPAIVTGGTVRQGAQIQQLLDHSYDGNGIDEASEGDNVIVAVIEAGGGYMDHDGFRENTPASSFRYATGGGSTGKWECSDTGCDSVNAFGSVSSHAMGAAGILFGDLEDGQMPAVPAVEWPLGSGYAPEARAHLYRFTDGTSGAIEAFDHIAGLTGAQRVPDLVSNSWGYFESPHCSGQGSVSRAANRLFLDGTAVFAAAHNQGGSANDCQVTSPGSAIGAFTVGAHLWGYEGDPNTVRTAGIYDNGEGASSSWGGHATAGQNRSIVSITGPGTRANKFNSSGTLSETGVICCTSLATPTVAGAAASFIDFYRDRWSNFIDNPGALYASLLLMGDRQGIGGKVNTSLDHRWGAGRLRTRMFNGPGLDAPWWYFNGWTCVSDGEVYDFAVADGGVLGADFDSFKAAAYWYDTRHDGSLGSGAGTVADVDLSLVDAANDNTLRGDWDAYDNKARLYYQDVGGRRVNLRLSGYNVEGHDDPVCGSDAIRVFFTFFAEDQDRESPVFNTLTGTGIFPEGW
jgi:hypothetical protein